MNYQWYPGHMTKAVRAMQDQIKLIDLIIELADARIPISSRNPDIDELGKGKYRILILNKADLADPEQNRNWSAELKKQGIAVLEMNSKRSDIVRSIKPLVQEVCKEKIERDKKRGIVGRPIRAMVCGIPNVGKSTFINSVAGKATAKTGNKPGVTRANQWIRTNAGIELLDTPGILWPKFDDPIVGRDIAFIGSMNDEIIQMQELATDLIKVILEAYPGALGSRYSIEESEDAFQTLERIAISRGCIQKGEEPDLEKAAGLLLDEFRSGKLGRMTLELPAAKEHE